MKDKDDRLCRHRKKRISQISGLLLLVGAILTVPHGDFRQIEAVPHFWFAIGVMGLGFVLSWSINSLTGVWFWLVAIFSRSILLPMYPGDDVWRYLWEGYIQTQGFSPYDLAPNVVELIPYRTSWWELINHLDVSAIYPPIAQLGFFALAAIAPSVLLFKLAFVAADLLVCWLLVRQFGYVKTLVYAWNPLVIYSFAGGAHYDSWFILPLVAAWFVFEGKRERIRSGWLPFSWHDAAGTLNAKFFLSSGLIGISAAIKWMSLPILSFLVWQAWRRKSLPFAIIVAIVGLLPPILSAIPFCHSGECPLIPTGSDFVSFGRSAELLPYLIGLIWARSREANWIYLLPLAIAGIVLLWKAKTFQSFASGYFFALLVISPIVHAWYFTWLVPFAIPRQNLGVRLVSLSVFVYFILQYRKALGNYDWLLSDLERTLLWLPFLVGFLTTIAIARDDAKSKC